MTPCRVPFQCIVPDHMLKRLLSHKDAELRERAMRSLLTTVNLRGYGRAVGPMMSVMANVTGGMRRTIYDASGDLSLLGHLKSGEGTVDSTPDDEAINVFNGFRDACKFFKSAYNRNSIGNRGMWLGAASHYGDGYDNAFWNGSQMVFGDGDGKVFNHFTVCLDVIGHELTHRVTQHECNLEYFGQSGALNESMSDVFGSLIKQYKLGQTAANADWLIGDGLLVNGGALRSMKAPGTAYVNDPILGTDPQPSNMSGYIKTSEDNGGVHLNSGIPNHAFYLAAVAIGGNAWDQAGWIWYSALPTLPATATFQQAADLICRSAVGIYGTSSKQADAVGNAWTQVGLSPAGMWVVATGSPRPLDPTE